MYESAAQLHEASLEFFPDYSESAYLLARGFSSALNGAYDLTEPRGNLR
jgi:hypothetical protein